VRAQGVEAAEALALEVDLLDAGRAGHHAAAVGAAQQAERGEC